MYLENLPERLLRLPPKRIEFEASEEEVIEADEGGVHYILSRERLPLCRPIDVFSLSVSGPQAERLAFIRKVEADLGKVLTIQEDELLPGIYFAFWEATEVEKKLKERK